MSTMKLKRSLWTGSLLGGRWQEGGVKLNGKGEVRKRGGSTDLFPVTRLSLPAEGAWSNPMYGKLNPGSSTNYRDLVHKKTDFLSELKG